MKFIIQSKPLSGDKWLFRAEVSGQWSAMIEFYSTIREDKRLKAKNDYRMINRKGESIGYSFQDNNK